MTVQPPEGTGRRVLATDLDGTLIPLEENRQNQDDLQILATQLVQREVTLLFVTGRHLDSVLEAINEFRLPQPEWIICDVGTSLFQTRASGDLRACRSVSATSRRDHRFDADPSSA